MGDMMTFPASVEEFMEQYKMTDTEHVYSNGTEYVPIYRMKQWFDHCRNQKLLTIDAVPVVRCKDCKYHEDEEIGMVYCPNALGGWVAENWFCAEGERKEGAE